MTDQRGILADIAGRARATGRLGIDTEFMGEGRYRSQLCLVQVAVEEDGAQREDVLHLLDLADALQRTLAERGRLEWAREECRALEEVTDERDLDSIFARLPRINSLEPSQRAVARELVEWREETARDGDRPVTT